MSGETPVYCNANAIIPEPPTTYIAESYQNAYETAFIAEDNVSLNSKNFPPLFANSLPTGFINGTFGYHEQEANNGEIITIEPLIVSEDNYQEQPYLFISTGSGGGSGYIYILTGL